MPSDKRVGVTHKDRIEWPQTDINGNSYVKPPSATAGLGGKFFAVLPYGYVDNGALAELRARYNPLMSSEPAKSKRSLADGDTMETVEE